MKEGDKVPIVKMVRCSACGTRYNLNDQQVALQHIGTHKKAEDQPKTFDARDVLSTKKERK